MNLAENLKAETENNRDFIRDVFPKLDEVRNTSDSKDDKLRLTMANRANEILDFGQYETKLRLVKYIGSVEYLKELLAAIRIAATNQNWEVQNKNINYAQPVADALISSNYNGVNINNFIKDIDIYINNSKIRLGNIEKAMDKKLLRILKWTP